jgi:hypothetical protein
MRRIDSLRHEEQAGGVVRCPPQQVSGVERILGESPRHRASGLGLQLPGGRGERGKILALQPSPDF